MFCRHTRLVHVIICFPVGHLISAHQNSQRNWIRGKNDSNFEPSQNFRTKKSEPSQNFDTWSIFRAEIEEKLNSSNFEPSQNHMHMLSCDMTSFDVFLSHLKIPPVPPRSHAKLLPHTWNNLMNIFSIEKGNDWMLVCGEWRFRFWKYLSQCSVQ